MALTLQQQADLLANNNENLRQRIEMKSVQYAGYLAGLTIVTGFFSGHTQTVYDKMQSFCNRVLMAKANNNNSLFVSIAMYWITAAQAELDPMDYPGTITDARITYFVESDVFLKLSGITGDEFAE